MQPSSSTLTIQHFSPTTRLYSLRSNRPVFRTCQDALIIASVALLIPFLTWPSLLAFAWLIFIFGWICRKLASVYAESVLILGPLGIQFSSTSLIGVTRRFVAREHIRQAIIHEAIVGWEVAFYLALVVEPDGAQMYIHHVFDNFQPQLDYLVTVWKGIREIVFQEEMHKIDPTIPLQSPKQPRLSSVSSHLEENDNRP